MSLYTITPIGQPPEPYREPGMWQLPVIVPKKPGIPGAEVRTLEGKNYNWLFWIGIAGLAAYALLSESKTAPALAEAYPKKQRGRRLYYMWMEPGAEEARSIFKKDLDYYHEKAMTTPGALHYVWAHTADEAREMIRTQWIRPVPGRRGVYELKAKPSQFSGTLYALWKPKSSEQFQRVPIESWTDYTLQQELGRGILKFVEAESLPEAKEAALSGTTANCGWWEEKFSDKLGKFIWRCSKYAPICAPESCVTGIQGKLRQCIATKKVPSRYFGKEISRCSKYSPVCTTGPCLPSTIPKPERLEEPEISEREVKSIAQGLAQRFTELQIESGPALAREILSRGGIAPYRRGYLKEEYKEIPLFLRNKRGLPLDEMASEMYMDESELVREIQKVYKKGRKTVRRASYRDFEDQARAIIMEEYRQGLRGLGQEQMEFWKLKRELVLAPEERATSDDPLEICLQRKGWDLNRVKELQISIAEKLTPDLFTGKTTKLSTGENELQRTIDMCLKALTKRSGARSEVRL